MDADGGGMSRKGIKGERERETEIHYALQQVGIKESSAHHHLLLTAQFTSL